MAEATDGLSLWKVGTRMLHKLLRTAIVAWLTAGRGVSSRHGKNVICYETVSHYLVRIRINYHFTFLGAEEC
jgi:hypothetical protein